MLINFSVENFRSFGVEQTLNMITVGRFQDHPSHCVPIGETGKSVLRIGVIYGANAAGKSNLVRAMEFAQNLICLPYRGDGPVKSLAFHQFRFGKKKKPSSFEFRFLVDEQIFVYGFAINQKAIVEEWLEATTEKGREVEVFSRKGQDISIGNLKAFHDEGKVSETALKMLEKLGIRPDQLLLNKVVETPRRGALLDRVTRWFTDCLVVVQPDSSFAPLIEFLDADADFRRFAGEFLHDVGTGIKELHIERSTIGADKLPKDLVEVLQSANAEETRLAISSPDVNFHLDEDNPTKVIRRTLAAKHAVNDSDYSMTFGNESDGTQRCLNLLPALYHLANRCKVFIIDELDRSLHPLLAHAFLKFFLDSCPGGHRQMIVTTHESHLLDQDLLRRDEIWFVEKDHKQQTQLYSLADLKIRNDLRIEKGYLQGRFGGIPFIGDTKKLMDMLECPTGKNSHAKKTSS